LGIESALERNGLAYCYKDLDVDDEQYFLSWNFINSIGMKWTPSSHLGTHKNFFQFSMDRGLICSG
jgi:hypothetical protein